MQFFVNCVVFVLLMLIKIGDGILFLLSLIATASLTIYKRTKNSLNSLSKKIQSKQIPDVTFPSIRLKNFSLLKRKTQKKRKKPIKVFPQQPYFMKIRYFAAGAFFTLFIIGIPLLIYTFLQSLPNPKTLTEQQVPQTTKIFDRNHVLLYQLYANQNRTEIHLADIPPIVRNATIAIEDKDFYHHPGFDVFAIIRSFIADATGKHLQGGSTITQQLIKSTLLTPETSLSRKIKEVVLAFWAERIYSKNQILEMYFNTVPYGGTSWGIEAASETYFGKDVKDLDLAQAAFLAGLPQAPSIYSPYSTTPNAWRNRQKEVLESMLRQGYITQTQETQALNEKLEFQSPQTPIYAPHFVMYVRNLLVQKYGLPLVEKGGLNVTTTLDLKKQEKVQQIVTNEVNADAYLNLSNGAALVTNPKNGDILAMVGSKNYNDPSDGAVNLTTSQRQPGSSIKIVTYAAALSRGYTAATMIDDSPVAYPSASGVYAPENYDGRFHGRVTLRTAFANSFNIPAVKTLNQIGIPAMVNLAKDMGITTWGDPSQYGLAITLGAAEVKMVDMNVVYGTVANEGNKVDLNPILKITDSSGNVVEQKQPSFTQQVVDPGVTYIISSILADANARVIEFGLNTPLNVPGHTVSVKTGTTDNKHDNWTFGYTPDYVVGVWVGNNDNSAMSQTLASGITGAAPIWHDIMTYLLDGKRSDEKMPIPSDIVQKPCYGKIEYFVKGTENSVNCGTMPLTVSPTKTP